MSAFHLVDAAGAILSREAVRLSSRDDKESVIRLREALDLLRTARAELLLGGDSSDHLSTTHRNEEPPSQISISAVIEIYKRRAKEGRKDPFARCRK